MICVPPGTQEMATHAHSHPRLDPREENLQIRTHTHTHTHTRARAHTQTHQNTTHTRTHTHTTNRHTHSIHCFVGTCSDTQARALVLTHVLRTCIDTCERTRMKTLAYNTNSLSHKNCYPQIHSNTHTDARAYEKLIQRLINTRA